MKAGDGRIKFSGAQMALSVIFGMAVFGLNLRLMAPTVTAGDSAELSTAQTTLGIAHSPGYPIFVLAGRAFSSVFSAGGPGYRTNAFSAGCSFLCGFFSSLLFLLWTSSLTFSLSAASTLLFLPVIRSQFLSTEVFALNFLFALLILLLCSFLLKEERHPGRAKWIYLSGLVMGLGLGNQHTLVLLFPAVLWIAFCEFKYEIKPYGLFALFFGLGLSAYAFLPVRSLQEPWLDWEDPQTLSRFWGVLTRARYGMFQLAQGSASEVSAGHFMRKAIFFVKEAAFHWTDFMAGLLAVGAMASLALKDLRKFGLGLLLFILLSGPVFLMLSNVSQNSAGYEIILRFLPLPFLGLFVLGAIGLGTLKLKLLFAAAFLSIGIFSFRSQSLRAEYLVHDYGRNVFKTLPRNSLLFSDRADEIEFAMAHFLYAEGKRPDVKFIDCNAGVTRSVYGDDYYKIWGKPRLEIRERVEKKIIQGSNGPVFYATLDPGMLSIKKIPNGLLYYAAPWGHSGAVNPEIYALRHHLLELGFRGDALVTTYGKLLGRYLLAEGNPEAAKRFFLLCAILNPGTSWNHHAALWCLENKSYDLAKLFFQRSLKYENEPDKVLWNLGALYEQAGDRKSAKDYYRQALALNPGLR